MKAKKEKNRSRLIAAALGKHPCDLTIENILLVNVITGEIYPAAVDVCDGVIVRVRDEQEKKPGLNATEVFDGKGMYLLPGFIDTHVHVESTMMTPEHFAEAVIPWGTTTVISDPHEIANVMGVEGVLFMLERAELAPLRHYMLAPPCVPSVPGIENSGSTFTEKEIAQLLDEPKIIGIGELMNYMEICQDNPRMHGIIDEGIKRRLFLQGHSPRLDGEYLAAYRLAGPVSDHECRSKEEAMKKTRQGFHINIKTSSLSNHLRENVSAVNEQRWRDNVSLCTDDVHAQVIFREGHLNRVVKKAIEYGADPLDAVRFATYNAAREYGFEDLGAIAPGYMADFQRVQELDGSCPENVWIQGRMVSEKGHMTERGQSPAVVMESSVNLSCLKSKSDFYLYAPGEDVETLVIYSRYDGPFNKSFYEKLPVRDGKVDISEDSDLAYICVCNRYGKEKKTIGVIRGFGVKSGAFCVTVAHDCHNLVMVYRDASDGFLAAKEIERMGGGLVLADAGKIISKLSLPVGGIMSPLTCEELAPEIEKMEAAVAAHCSGNSLLKLATVALPVLPGTSITDEGIVDGMSREILALFKNSVS